MITNSCILFSRLFYFSFYLLYGNLGLSQLNVDASISIDTLRIKLTTYRPFLTEVTSIFRHILFSSPRLLSQIQSVVVSLKNVLENANIKQILFDVTLEHLAGEFFVAFEDAAKQQSKGIAKPKPSGRR